ncbi:MAG TPA: hypothetical protein DIC60_05010 [Lachnospiraceae bacterium]|nr:hypothetical protein [Lachnospiraceae bacterium]
MKKILITVLVFVFLLSGCESKTLVPKDANQEISISKIFNLYFSDGGQKLAKEQRNITYTTSESLEKKVLEELVKGPTIDELRAVVSPTTKVNSVKVYNGTAIVDLSGEFLTGLNGGSELENLRIYSIVDTLTELSNINKVQFLIDGKKGRLLGQTELDGDFERDETVIKM